MNPIHFPSFFTGSAERVENVSMAVAITVLVLLFLSFAGLFFIYYRYFRKSVDNALEDRYILRDMVRRSRPFFVEVGKSYDAGSTEGPSYLENLEEKKKKARGWKILSNSVLVAFYLAFVALMAAAVSIRAQGDSFLVGDKTYLVIKTGSMETVNSANSYIDENNLDDQIMAYSLIEIEEVKEEDMKLYDIYAFRANGTIVVHRLISMGKNGEIRYAFRGDANASSASYEVSVPFDDILGVYTGWNSFELGLFVNYAQSYIGIITIALALILIGFYDIMDAAIGKRIELREKILSELVDADIKDRFARRMGYPYLLYLDRSVKLDEIIPPFKMPDR